MDEPKVTLIIDVSWAVEALRAWTERDKPKP